MRRLHEKLAHGWAPIVLFAGISFALNATVSWIQFPVPVIHDEFSYLLAADTYAHGRLANPTHPMWRHFESFHIIHQPTYASKYPPGQGLLLATGIQLGGHAIVGSWLGMALAAASVYWMLRAWVPNRWAIVGGILATFHYRIVFEWGQSYWGGQLAMTGGALVFGALPRLQRRMDPRNAVTLAIGLVILANTRPFEGLVVSIPLAIYLLIWLCRVKRNQMRSILVRVVLPISAVLVTAAIAMMYYNDRVTGRARRMPYYEHYAQYGIAHEFAFVPLKTAPDYRHEMIRKYHAEVAARTQGFQNSLKTWWETRFYEIKLNATFLLNNFSFVLTIPLICTPWILCKHRSWFVLVILGCLFVASLPVIYLWPHYLAPGVPLFLLLVTQSLRVVRTCRWPARPAGRILVRTLLLSYIVTSVLGFAALSLTDASKNELSAWATVRSEVTAKLEQSPEQHLIFVRYSPEHRVHQEWIYNAADIDAAKIVWAREMSAQQNRQLIDYFFNRTVWIMHADADPPRLLPFAQTPHVAIEPISGVR